MSHPQCTSVLLDYDTLQYRLNESASAMRGRRESFLRVCQTFNNRAEKVLGMWINSNKGDPYEVPWVDESIVDPIKRMINFQELYYPLEKPVDIEESKDFDSIYKKRKGQSFPIFRDPRNRLGAPISAQQLRDYWSNLLHHCQDVVNEELGYEYPLFHLNGSPRFDIHSLRVSIITTLLENSVPVSVVQSLVGHKSPIMTWYYDDVSNGKIHRALQEAMQSKKASMIDAGDDKAELMSSLSESAVTLRSSRDFVGPKSVEQSLELGGQLDVFAHGICPGGDCGDGGERIAEGRYRPVWRPRACSGCRYRVTGPAFINGLAQRANTLMWEIKQSMRREEEVFAEIEIAEDSGRGTDHMRSNVRAEQTFRDQLFSEWCLEIQTIHKVSKDYPIVANGDRSQTDNLPSLLPQDGLMDLRFQEVHDLVLASRLVEDSKIVGGQIDLPADVRLYRDHALLRIAQANDIAQYFYHVRPHEQRAAFDAFGRLIAEQDVGIDEMQSLIEGSRLLDDVPGLHDALINSMANQRIGADR